MNYIIDEELRNKIYHIANILGKHDLTNSIVNLQPVELVAEGVIRYDVQQVDEEEWELAGVYLECGEKKYWLNDVLPYDFLIKNENVNIKIYIVKE